MGPINLYGSFCIKLKRDFILNNLVLHVLFEEALFSRRSDKFLKEFFIKFSPCTSLPRVVFNPRKKNKRKEKKREEQRRIEKIRKERKSEQKNRKEKRKKNRNKERRKEMKRKDKIRKEKKEKKEKKK